MNLKTVVKDKSIEHFPLSVILENKYKFKWCHDFKLELHLVNSDVYAIQLTVAPLKGTALYVNVSILLWTP